MLALAPSPSQPPRVVPYGLMSLWDMLKAYAANYVAFAEILVELDAAMASTAPDAWDKPMSLPEAKKFDRLLKRVMALGNDLALPSVTAQMTRFMELLEDGVRGQKLLSAHEALRERLHDELKSHLFFYVPTERVACYGAGFGDDVTNAFRETPFDIEEAGKCLALGRSTACVFHLMRAMECAVQALAARLGFLNPDREWGKLLSDVHGKIEAMPKGEMRNRWSASHAHLYHVKQAWRNDTMHPKNKYTEEEGGEVYAAVRTFMRHLAKLV